MAVVNPTSDLDRKASATDLLQEADVSRKLYPTKAIPNATAWLRVPSSTSALFIRLIIRLFQLVFLAGTVFFSHNKSANSVFQPAYQHSRTAPSLPTVQISRDGGFAEGRSVLQKNWCFI
jgi:hypothetical protein